MSSEIKNEPKTSEQQIDDSFEFSELSDEPKGDDTKLLDEIADLKKKIDALQTERPFTAPFPPAQSGEGDDEIVFDKLSLKDQAAIERLIDKKSKGLQKEVADTKSSIEYQRYEDEARAIVGNPTLAGEAKRFGASAVALSRRYGLRVSPKDTFAMAIGLEYLNQKLGGKLKSETKPVVEPSEQLEASTEIEKAATGGTKPISERGPKSGRDIAAEAVEAALAKYRKG